MSYGAQIPGFRPGTSVPDSVLINFIGPEQIRSSAVEAVLKKTLPEAMSSVSSHVTTQNSNLFWIYTEISSFAVIAQKKYFVELGMRWLIAGRWAITEGF